MKTQMKSQLKTAARRNISKLSGRNSRSMLDTALEGAQSVGKSVSGALRAENLLPIAIGAFVLGTAAGVLGTLYLPKLLSSDLVQGLGTRLNQATTSVGHSLNQAKDAVISKVKEVASDRNLKSAIGRDNGVENTDTMSPTRIA
jgi:hypothetical protein